MDAKQFVNWLLQASIICVGILLMNQIGALTDALNLMREQVATIRSEQSGHRLQLDINTRTIEKHDVWIRELQRK